MSYASKLTQFLQVLRNHPVLSENYLDMLSQVTRVLDATCASLYLYEKKTNMFILRKWSGHEPCRCSISGDYEFVSFIKNRGTVVHRSEFSPLTSNEMRNPALYYFQQTLSNVVCPLLDTSEWIGLLNLQVEDVSRHEAIVFYNDLIELFAEHLKQWLICQKLAQDNRRLSELSDIKNQLLSNVTHELQTPLNAILGVSEVLLASPDEELGSETKLKVGFIEKAGKELSQTVSNLLNLVQIEAKKDTLRREKIAILGVIREVALLYTESCTKKSVQIVIPSTGDDICVFAHADQLRTVFMNLLGNAVKFTQKGHIGISLKKSGEMLHVSVFDTGIGIDDEKLGLIFEEFYQADGSQTRLYGGTGLGLAIAKKIISIHQGRIWAESQKGVGSKFTFTLPLYPV